MSAGRPGGATGGIVWWRVALWTVLAALAVAAPQVLAAGDVNRLSEVIYIAVAALGLALLTGFNGQISLGHGAFLGMGAYITMILTVDYGVSYAVASLSCTLPIFLAIVSQTFSRDSFLDGVAVYIAYALGMGLVLMSLTLLLAFAKHSMVHSMKRILP